MTTYSNPTNFKQPVLQYTQGKKDFVLIDDYVFTWSLNNIERQIAIPAGQDYDKASVPPIFWGIARPDGPYEASSLLHDLIWLYKGKLPTGWYKVKINGAWENGSPWTMRQSNDLFEWMSFLGGATKTQAKLYRTAVEIWPPNWFKRF